VQLGVVSAESGTFNGGVGGEQAVQQPVWNMCAALERDRQVHDNAGASRQLAPTVVVSRWYLISHYRIADPLQ
jgi:hypothetical protein